MDNQPFNKEKVNTKRKQSLIHHIIHLIDPHASLYTFAMFNQAEGIFKNQLTDFISKDITQKWLGPKKSRVILAWITKNNHGVINEMGKIVGDFMSWLLNKNFKFIPDNTAPIIEPDVIYFIYENKTFVIK